MTKNTLALITALALIALALLLRPSRVETQHYPSGAHLDEPEYPQRACYDGLRLEPEREV